MIVTKACIAGAAIKDWTSFHDEFDRVFGFPRFYGRNLNAWIDCMSAIDCEEDGLTSIHVVPGGVLALQIEHAAELKRSAPDQYEALVECAGFVNWRRLEQGDSAILALSFYV